MSEDVAVALGGRKAAIVLGCFKITVGGVVKATMYVTGCPPIFWLACFDIRF